MEDISGSARHYFGADNVILLECEPAKSSTSAAPLSEVKVSVKKSRRGDCGDFSLVFDYRRHTFRFDGAVAAVNPASQQPRKNRPRD